MDRISGIRLVVLFALIVGGPLSVQGQGVVTPVEDPVPGQDVVVGVEVVDFAPVAQLLFYRMGGEVDFRQAAVEREGSFFSGVIPGPFVTPRGVEYYFLLSNGQQTLLIPPIERDARPAQLRVRLDGWQAPFQLDERQYRMMSVPADLADPGVLAVLEDDLGPYAPQAWDVFGWDAAGERYLSLPSAGFEPGLAYWVVSRERAQVDVDNARSTDLSASVLLVLQPGWNQLGNPFAFRLGLNSIEEVEGLEPPVTWDGTRYVYDIEAAEPWEGYFVYNANPAPTDLVILPEEAETGLLAKQEAGAGPFDEAGYRVQVTARAADRGWGGAQCFLAIDESGAERRLHEAPGIGDRVRVSIVEEQTRLAGRMKPHSGEGAWWDLEVAVEEPSSRFPTRAQVDLALLEEGARPPGFEVFVLDLDRDRLLPLRDGRLSLDVSSAVPRNLRIVLGTPAYAAAHAGGIPLATGGAVLDPVYPNPFVREAAVSYQLHEQASVRLTIYDVLGRPVRALVDAAREPGAYTVRWSGVDDDGRPLAAGLYLVRLETGATSVVRAVMFAR